MITEPPQIPYIPFHDLDDLERSILQEVPDACQSPAAIAQLSRATKYCIERSIPGAFVECGVYQGASIVCIIRTLQAMGVSDREIWLYDTFEGMPKPQAVDTFHVATPDEDGALKTWEKRARSDGSGGSHWVYAPLEFVHQRMLGTGYPQNRLYFVRGMVEQTIPQRMPQAIALLRLDTDFYSSTKHELSHLYPRVATGGPVIIDDYGAYKGSRLATDELLAASPQPILLSRIDEHVRIFTKPA
jgi:O-methyltransferase